MIPSNQELAEVIRSAQCALDHHRDFWLGNAGKVELEFYELDLLERDERFMALDIALSEITPNDYDGPNPPGDISSHPPFQGCRMFAFCWNSAHFARRLYFKFALTSPSGKTQMAKPKLVIYSFHEPRTRV
jgi:hypothetical protein